MTAKAVFSRCLPNRARGGTKEAASSGRAGLFGAALLDA
jgi:hypothetical protein